MYCTAVNAAKTDQQLATRFPVNRSHLDALRERTRPVIKVINVIHKLLDQPGLIG